MLYGTTFPLCTLIQQNLWKLNLKLQTTQYNNVIEKARLELVCGTMCLIRMFSVHLLFLEVSPADLGMLLNVCVSDHFKPSFK